MLLYNRLNQRDCLLYLKHFALDATETAPSQRLNFQVSFQETFCSSSQIPHIYISQKSPESYKFLIRNYEVLDVFKKDIVIMGEWVTNLNNEFHNLELQHLDYIETSILRSLVLGTAVNLDAITGGLRFHSKR